MIIKEGNRDWWKILILILILLFAKGVFDVYIARTSNLLNTCVSKCMGEEKYCVSNDIERIGDNYILEESEFNNCYYKMEDCRRDCVVE